MDVNVKLEYLDFYKSELGSGKHCTKSFGASVWQHQQEKIDELSRILVGQKVYINRLQEHNLLLQKRLKEHGLDWKDLIT